MAKTHILAFLIKAFNVLGLPVSLYYVLGVEFSKVKCYPKGKTGDFTSVT